MTFQEILPHLQAGKTVRCVLGDEDICFLVNNGKLYQGGMVMNPSRHIPWRCIVAESWEVCDG